MGWIRSATAARGRSRGGGRTSRVLASAGAALAVGVGALVVGAGGTAGAANFAPRGPVATPIALHSAYLADLAHVRTGKRYGVVPPRRKGASAASLVHPLTTYGTTPVMTWHGGPVQHSPHLYLLLWGPNWTSTAAQKASAGYLATFLRGLGTEGATPDHWSTITDQYKDSTGHPSFSTSVYVQAYITTTTPPHGANQTQLGAEALAFAQTHGLSTHTTDQVIVATQSGTCPTGFAGCGNFGTFCAWHSNVYTVSGTVPYTNLPYLPDANTAGYACGEGFRPSSTPTNEGFSIVGGHEYAETVTDPLPASGWITTGTYTGGEIGDKCAWSTKSTAVSFATGSFVVQPLFSNAARRNTGNGCVLSATLPASKPGKPAPPTATAGPGHAVVSWTAAATNGSPITKYVVVSSGGQKCVWTSGPLTCTVKNLTNGQSYTFRVRAVNAIGYGPFSTPSNTVVPVARPGKPAPPTATAGNASATVSWTAAATNGSPITKYVVVSSGGQKCFWTSGPLTCTVEKLTNGTSYTFRVRAVNAIGGGPFSTPSTAVVPAA